MRLMCCLLVVSLAGCTSDDCDLVGGLHVRSSDPTAAGNASPNTAVGGTQHYTGFTDTCAGEMATPVTRATPADYTIATSTVVDGAIEVTGVSPGVTTIDATGMGGEDFRSVGVVAIDHVAVQPSTVTRGASSVTILLLDSGSKPAIDDSLTVSGPFRRGDTWNHLLIGTASAGQYTETIHAGGVDWPVTVTVVHP